LPNEKIFYLWRVNIKILIGMKRIIAIIASILSIATLSSCEQLKSLCHKEQETVVGGYSKTRKLSDQEKELFHQTTATLQGVEYEPENVATQIVAGTNYRFLCKARLLDEKSKKGKRYYAVIVIHKPLSPEEPPRILSIEREPR
jgi:hypothetical protein